MKMRHSEEQDICDSLESDFCFREDYLVNLERPNKRVPNMFLDDCISLKGNLFKEIDLEADVKDLIYDTNGEYSLLKNSFFLGAESEANERQEFDTSKNVVFTVENGEPSTESDPSSLELLSKYARKNKRKSLLPQRAVQSEHSQSSSICNSSESSQDVADNYLFTLNIVEQTSPEVKDNHQNDNALHELETKSIADCCGNDLLSDMGSDDNFFRELHETLNDGDIPSAQKKKKTHWTIKCNMCAKLYSCKTDFDQHYKESYKIPPVYTCTSCNKTYEKYSTFRSNCYRHITEGRYKCEICLKRFSLQSTLNSHKSSKHFNKKPHVCVECGKGFVAKLGLSMHMKKHKGEQREDYPCAECGKVLHTRGGLTSHMNVHRLGRRFMCDVCGKTFTQKVNMQQHVKQHTGDKPHECDKCGKAFAERSHLARHYSFHSDERPFKCDVCQKMYKTERCLKVHSLVHAAERPFVCAYCNKGFLSTTKLKQHSNIHTGERPYKCKYCERTFTNYPNWMKHIRRRHKVDHKTGEQLQPTLPKEEVPTTPTPAGLVEIAPAPAAQDNLTENSSFNNPEEMIMQQSLLTLPLVEDKFITHQQIQILSATNNSTTNFIVPYFQAQLNTSPHSTFQGTTSLHLTDLIQMNTLAYCD